jgi:phosphatidylserine/phosphatidylglycerophosphate/cardiolipin synthase-like enzyme
LPWTRVKKPYLHGKSILVDHHKIFLWSQNLTTNSLQNNREVWVIISDSWVLYSKIFNSYQKDCNFE